MKVKAKSFAPLGSKMLGADAHSKNKRYDTVFLQVYAPCVGSISSEGSAGP